MSVVVNGLRIFFKSPRTWDEPWLHRECHAAAKLSDVKRCGKKKKQCG